MHFNFQKYHGTGNDFIMVDNRDGSLSKLEQEDIAWCCHRRFGIGADGFILIENDPDADFRMVYYNSDGRESSMCGNGGRCSVVFARSLGMGSDEQIVFRAIDGLHHARITDQLVDLQMIDVPEVKGDAESLHLDTGSPHHVVFVEDVETFPVHEEGRRIRHEVYGSEGCNVNFVTFTNGVLQVRTYERGVEAETYSCGTGVTASALAAHHAGLTKATEISVHTPGGELSVRFARRGSGYADVHLIGPVTHVFNGEWIL